MCISPIKLSECAGLGLVLRVSYKWRPFGTRLFPGLVIPPVATDGVLR